MTYRYLYQTSENENREGTIIARDRQSAYAALRKQGIRPYRLIGNDPLPWRPWAVGMAFVALAIALTLALWRDGRRDDLSPKVRQQIYGDTSVIAAGELSGWANVLESPLDRFLAAYAQPGRTVRAQRLADVDRERALAELAIPMSHEEGERDEYRQLRNIVAWMRKEMREYLAAGGTVDDYCALLDERQEEERVFRSRAEESILRAPDCYRYRAWLGVNARLRDMGIAPLDVPAGLTGGFL